MPVVRPFRGILYDAAVVGPIASVVAPPYDVVGPEEQNRLYEASPFNVIRLDLSRESDRYGSASRSFARCSIVASSPASTVSHTSASAS